MADSAKLHHVYTVKTLKEILQKAKSWEWSEDDFVGICECIEGALKDKKSLDPIKPYFKRLDKLRKKATLSGEYNQAKTLLCNSSYLLKHPQLQLVALQQVGYNSELVRSPELTSDATRPGEISPELTERRQSVSKVTDMIEQLTNELEKEKKRTSRLEGEKREIKNTLQEVFNQSTEIEASLAQARSGQQTRAKHTENNKQTASLSMLSTFVKDSLKQCADHFENLKEDNIAREKEATCHVKELRDKVSTVSIMIGTLNTPGIEVTRLSRKKTKKGKAKTQVPQSEEYQATTEKTSVIKITSKTLDDILLNLQELWDSLKSVHDMVSWISEADKAVKAGQEIQSQSEATPTKQESLLCIPDKIREHIERMCQGYKEQRKEVSNLKENVEHLKNENEEFHAKYQTIEQKHQKHEQGMEVLSQLKQQLEDDRTTIKEKEDLQQTYTKEICQLKDDLAAKEESIQQLRQENKILSERHLQENEDLSQLEQKIEDATAVIQDKEDLLQTYTEEICKLEGNIANKEKVIQQLWQQNETLSERYKSDMTSMDTDLRKLREMISAKDEEIKQLKTRNGELLTRLSKQAEMRLTDGNHGITDLSDPNRPTSLAEKFSELYDNEWTEAFEEVMENKQKAMTEQSAITFLLEILNVTNDFCKRQADIHWKDILDVVCQQSTDQLPQIPPIYSKDLRNVRKLTGNISAEGVIKRFFESDTFHHKLHSDEKGANLELYIRKCVELCWLMSIQSPPIFLYSEVHLHDRFDEDYFKFYTCAGTAVDFVVWPALLCSENGDLLRKGVCQGLKKK